MDNITQIELVNLYKSKISGRIAIARGNPSRKTTPGGSMKMEG